MEIGLLLTIVGVVFTLAFGIWGLALARRAKYPGAVTVFFENVIPLFEAIVQSVPDLGVTFRGVAVEPGLSLMKLLIVNTGTIDIEPAMVEGRITLKLPRTYKWLAATVVGAAPNVVARAEIEAEGVTLQTGLFRSNEFLRLDLIVQLPITKSDGPPSEIASGLRHDLTVSHRISNTRKVKTVDLQRDQSEFAITNFAPPMLGALWMVLAVFGWAYWREGPPVYLRYHAVINGRLMWVTAEPQSDNTVYVKEVDGKYSSRLPSDEFFLRHIRGTNTTRLESETMMLVVIASVAVFMSLYVAVSTYRRRSLRRLIATSSKDT